MLGAHIKEGAARMGIALTDRQAGQFSRYHEMLVDCNRTMNLTRVAEDALEAADRNYLDSLAPLGAPGLMDGVRTLADIGSGAGCPGIPLAIARPDTRVTLIDALDKRVKFLNSVIEALGLNARAVHMRLEDAGREACYRAAFDMVTARALADTPVLLELGLPLLRVGGVLAAYKGPAVGEELARSDRALEELGGRVRAVASAPVPGRDWDHRLLLIEKTRPTPPKYPRKAGEPGRKPL